MYTQNEVNKRSRKTLRRLENNDSTLDIVQVGRDDFGAGDEYKFNSCNAKDISKLGKALGNNTHVRFLSLEASHGLDETSSVFYNGLKQNSSIRSLFLGCSHRNASDGKFMWLDNEVVHEILRVYQQNNNLTYLSIHRANQFLQNGGNTILAKTLGHTTKLKKLHLQESNITNEQLLPIAEAMRGLRSLEELNLSQNRIGNDGCETIASLLEDPNSRLNCLYLNGNQINDEGVITVIKSLANNTKLRELYIDHSNPTTDSIMQQSFSRLLCNTSSINSLHSSNHTLRHLSTFTITADQRWHPGPHLSLLLQMNTDRNKSHVAIRKILNYYPDIDMTPLFDLGLEDDDDKNLKALPYLIAWFDEAYEAWASGNSPYTDLAKASSRTSCSEIRRKKLCAIYQFVQAMPHLCALSMPLATNKEEESIVKETERVEMESTDESTKKSRVETESMNKVATDNCCVIL